MITNRAQRRTKLDVTRCRYEMRRMFRALGIMALEMNDAVMQRKLKAWDEYVKPIAPKIDGIKKAHKEMVDYCASIEAEVKGCMEEISTEIIRGEKCP